jgi:hypothetical protein
MGPGSGRRGRVFRLAHSAGRYGFATAISASRITARRHFPSDVVVGDVFGYLIGDYVVHHNSSMDQAESSFTVIPIIDDSQRTYGLTVMFTPDSKDLPRMGYFLRKIGSLLGTGDSRSAEDLRTQSRWTRGVNQF